MLRSAFEILVWVAIAVGLVAAVMIAMSLWGLFGHGGYEPHNVIWKMLFGP